MLSVGKQAYVVQVQPRILVHLQPTNPEYVQHSLGCLKGGL